MLMIFCVTNSCIMVQALHKYSCEQLSLAEKILTVISVNAGQTPVVLWSIYECYLLFLLCIWGWHTKIVTKQNSKCILFSTFKVTMKAISHFYLRDSKFVYWIFNGGNVGLELDFYALEIDWIGKSGLLMRGP